MGCLRGMSDTNVNSNLSANIILAVKHGASCSISIMCFDNEIKQLKIARDIVGWCELGSVMMARFGKVEMVELETIIITMLGDGEETQIRC